MRVTPLCAAIAVVALAHSKTANAQDPTVALGPRPAALVAQMAEGPLKTKLRECRGPFKRSNFSIGHRGAPLEYPEHTQESYEAAARMGAGVIECDVTFTKDRVLVCRHSQCDLHTTTDILSVPDLAAKCTQGFTAADPAGGRRAGAKCCTSDLTLAEFKRLRGRMDSVDPAARTVADYLELSRRHPPDIANRTGTLLTHAESIALFRRLGVKFTPELKVPEVTLPVGGFTQERYAQQMIDEYKAAGVDPKDVFPQSFRLDDIRYWLKNEPAFAAQAVFLDERYKDRSFKSSDEKTWTPSMTELAAAGVKIIGPPIWMLLTLDGGKIVPSPYATAARKAGLDIIAWSLERDGSLARGGGWYHQSVRPAIKSDGDTYEVLDVLARQAGIRGIFSDWPATSTFYANCMGIP